MRRTLLGTGVAAALAAGLVGSSLAPVDAAPAPRDIAYHQWSGPSGFQHGRMAGVRLAKGGRLRIAQPLGTVRHAAPDGHARRYEFGRWTSRWVRPHFGLTQLVPSWDARTWHDTWIRVQVRGISTDGRRSSWDTIANWSAGDHTFHRTSLGTQADDLASVATDTWVTQQGTQLRSWKLRLTLFRRAGTHATPRVRTVGAVASNLPAQDSTPTSRPGVASAHGTVLDVPRFSQMTHSGDYQQYGGGGEAWCSPTSTSMVLGYYGRLPRPRAYSWVRRPHRDRFVDHAARMTYDYAYEGTGNWPFNAAYAAGRTGSGFVTRLHDLAEAEWLVEAGIPVVASIAFGYGELDHAPIHATAGHLVVVVGFRKNGNVVVNDPAARHNRGVRRTYDRGQFERAWLDGSGGMAYVIHDAAHPLPSPVSASW